VASGRTLRLVTRLQQVAIHGNSVVALGQQTTASGTVPLAELSADGGPESAEGQELPAVAQPGMGNTNTSRAGLAIEAIPTWLENRSRAGHLMRYLSYGSVRTVQIGLLRWVLAWCLEAVQPRAL
jgi:hypothetical protein